MNQVRETLDFNKFYNVNIAENVIVNWETVKETQKGNFKIAEIQVHEQRASTLESNFLENHIKYQIATIESEERLNTYFIEAYTNKGSIIYPGSITKLNDFTGTLNVFLLNGHNLGSLALYNGRARNISENDTLNVFAESINAFANKSDTTNKIPQCGGNYTVFIDQTLSRFDVWTVGDKIVAINYLGTTTTRTTSIMPFPCDGVYDKNDILNQRLELYTYKDGSNGVPNASNISPPSCESFSFVRKNGANWQEALVKNVSFRIILLTPPNHIEITQIISYPQPISFGMPVNFNKGNIDVTPGVAATVSARILQLAMDNTVAKYGNKEVSELTVRLYFQEQLIKEYRDYSNGGIVNFNSTSNIIATQYKTNPLSSGNCD